MSCDPNWRACGGWASERLATFISVLSSLLVGVVLAIAPWTALWETNYFAAMHPAIRDWMDSSFTRGAVTGLGLVNLALAVYDLRHRPHPTDEEH